MVSVILAVIGIIFVLDCVIVYSCCRISGRISRMEEQRGLDRDLRFATVGEVMRAMDEQAEADAK